MFNFGSCPILVFWPFGPNTSDMEKQISRDATAALHVVRTSLKHVPDPQKRVAGEIALAALQPIFEDPSLSQKPQKRRRSRKDSALSAIGAQGGERGYHGLDFGVESEVDIESIFRA